MSLERSPRRVNRGFRCMVPARSWLPVRITRSVGPAIDGLADGDLEVVVEVGGDVDAETAPALIMALLKAITDEPRVCCDLSGTGFFGADGANVLAAAHLHAAQARHTFSLRGVHGMAARVLDVTGLNRILLIVD